MEIKYVCTFDQPVVHAGKGRQQRRFKRAQEQGPSLLVFQWMRRDGGEQVSTVWYHGQIRGCLLAQRVCDGRRIDNPYYVLPIRGGLSRCSTTPVRWPAFVHAAAQTGRLIGQQ